MIRSYYCSSRSGTGAELHFRCVFIARQMTASPVSHSSLSFIIMVTITSRTPTHSTPVISRALVLKPHGLGAVQGVGTIHSMEQK